MDSYSPWDLIHRYLMPDWWIIPIYTTITAWIATVAWWRRAVRLGKDWAQRLLLVIDNGPPARRRALRCTAATPFLLIPVIAMFCWYVLGSMLWLGFHAAADSTILGANYLSVSAAIYAGGAVAFIAWYDDDFEGWFSAFWGGLPAAPLALFGVFGFLFGLLISLTDRIIGGQGAWPMVWSGLMLIGAAVLAIVALWAGGRAARKGIEVISGAFSTALRSSLQAESVVGRDAHRRRRSTRRTRPTARPGS